MFKIAALALALTSIATFAPQGGDKDKASKRYGIELNSKKYPQNTPKDALGSVLKAIGEKQIDYLLAHLADPVFVDKQVALAMARLDPSLSDAQKKERAFDRVVQTISDNFKQDPSKLQDLQRVYKEGEWQEDGDAAVAKVKGTQPRKVVMKRIPTDRWVLLDNDK